MKECTSFTLAYPLVTSNRESDRISVCSQQLIVSQYTKLICASSGLKGCEWQLLELICLLIRIMQIVVALIFDVCRLNAAAHVNGHSNCVCSLETKWLELNQCNSPQIILVKLSKLH